MLKPLVIAAIVVFGPVYLYICFRLIAEGWYSGRFAAAARRISVTRNRRNVSGGKDRPEEI